jgi:hypothetical protein
MEANGRNPGNFNLKQVPRISLCYIRATLLMGAEVARMQADRP